MIYWLEDEEESPDNTLRKDANEKENIPNKGKYIIIVKCFQFILSLYFINLIISK